VRFVRLRQRFKSKPQPLAFCRPAPFPSDASSSRLRPSGLSAVSTVSPMKPPLIGSPTTAASMDNAAVGVGWRDHRVFAAPFKSTAERVWLAPKY
jgi:hypothetical protein